MAKTQTAKVKKKVWVTILAPKSLNERPIGEAYVAEPGLLVGRVVSCNLMSLTDNIKNQNANMKFFITDIRDNKAQTRPVSFELNQTFIKRMMRRKKNRVDESLPFKTADNKNVRIKLFLLTNNTAKSSAISKLRVKIKEETKNLVNRTKYDELFDSVVMHRVQSKLRGVLNKIVPLKVCEVRVLKEEKEKRKIGEKQTIEKVEIPEEKKEERTENKKEEALKEEKKKVGKKETKKLPSKNEKSFRSEASKPFRKIKDVSKSLEKSETSQKEEKK